MSSRFIVIEGTDGSGKETQARLLVEHFKKRGTPTLYLDFPQYQTFFGEIIAKYLRGEFGSISQTSPYLISIIYALDRSTVREKIEELRSAGGVIVANRYVPSNVAHQAANIENPTDRTKFIRWIQELEYEQLHLPREDTVIYLDLPWNIAMTKSREKLATGSGHDYLKGKEDIHEESESHRRNTVKVYEELLNSHAHWKRISCTDAAGEQASIEEVHRAVLASLGEVEI